MSELVIVKKSDIVAVADAVRRNSDTTEPMTLGEIIEGIDEIGATGITPEGTIEITENGTYDVTTYASATVEVGGGGESDVNPLDALIDGSITEVTSNATSVKKYKFSDCKSLTTVDLPNAKYINSYAFQQCSKLSSVLIPNANTIGSYAFEGCTELTFVNSPNVVTVDSSAFYMCRKLPQVFLPNANTIGMSAFKECYLLVTVDLPKVTSINSSAFNICYSLKSLIIRSETMCTLSNTNTFNYCYHFLGTVDKTYNPNGDKDGYIYVPKSLIEDYKVATNWVTYASQFRALEDYTVDGTTTGELDETKI